MSKVEFFRPKGGFGGIVYSQLRHGSALFPGLETILKAPMWTAKEFVKLRRRLAMDPGAEEVDVTQMEEDDQSYLKIGMEKVMNVPMHPSCPGAPIRYLHVSTSLVALMKARSPNMVWYEMTGGGEPPNESEVCSVQRVVSDIRALFLCGLLRI